MAASKFQSLKLRLIYLHILTLVFNKVLIRCKLRYLFLLKFIQSSGQHDTILLLHLHF